MHPNQFGVLWNFFLTGNRNCNPSQMETSAFPLTSSFVGRDGDINVKVKSIEERKNVIISAAREHWLLGDAD